MRGCDPLREGHGGAASRRAGAPGSLHEGGLRPGRYLREGDQLTLLALAGEVCVGCATLCYLSVLPTADHPTGLRAHLMNVYTLPGFRRRGVARTLVTMLLDATRKRGAVAISLNATEAGRPLYLALGFRENGEGMTLNL